MDMLDERVSHTVKFELMADLRNCYEHEFIIKVKEEDIGFSWECLPYDYRFPIATGKVTMDGEMINIDIFKCHPLFKDKEGNVIVTSIDHFKEQITEWFLNIE